MITIISGTNRIDSMTIKVAKLYQQLFKEKGAGVEMVSLEGLNVWERGAALKEIESKYFIPAQKIVFIMPEYNGSFPGILKLMLDNSDIKKCWWHKKAMLVGVADGRGGNLRGLEHMTGVLHYLKMNILYNKLPLSKINDEVDEKGQLLRAATVAAINEQIEEFLAF